MLLIHPLKFLRGRRGLLTSRSLDWIPPKIIERRLVARCLNTKARPPTSVGAISGNATHLAGNSTANVGPAAKSKVPDTPSTKSVSFAESVLNRLGPLDASYRQLDVSKAEKARRVFNDIFGRPSMDEMDIAAELERNPASAISVLQRSMESGKATARVVHMCVMTRWSELQSMSRRSRQSLHSQILDQQLSRVVLRHILPDINLWFPLVYAGYEMWLPICYFAIVEGNERIIRDWLGVDVLEFEDNPQAYKWRGKILSSLVDAHGHLDTRNCADPMLQCLMDVAAQKDAAFRDGHGQSILSLDLKAATVTAAIKLTKNNKSWHNTDSALYDRFVIFYGRLGDTPDNRIRGAWLRLDHPKTPEERGAMAIAEEYLAKDPGDTIAYLTSRTSRQRAAHTLRNLFSRTAKVAEDNGNAKGAAWIRNEVLRKVDKDFGSHSLRPESDSSSRKSNRLPPSRVSVSKFQR